MRINSSIILILSLMYSISFSQCLDKEEISRLQIVFKPGMPKDKALKLAEEYNWIKWGNCWNDNCSFRTTIPNDYKNYYVLRFNNDTLVNFKLEILGALSFDWYVKQFRKSPPGYDSIVQAVKNGYDERMRQRNITVPCEGNKQNKYSDSAKTLPIDSMLTKLQLGVTDKEVHCILYENGWRWNKWLKTGQTKRKVVDRCGDTLGIIQPIKYYIFEPNGQINENTLCLVIVIVYEGDNNSEYNWVDEIKAMTSKEIQKKYYYREYLNEERKKQGQKGFWEPRRSRPARRPIEN